jgi:hypothetical protein
MTDPGETPKPNKSYREIINNITNTKLIKNNAKKRLNNATKKRTGLFHLIRSNKNKETIKSSKQSLNEIESKLNKLYEQKSLSELNSATTAVKSSY